MDNSELKTLEEKTRNIVSTLENLEMETKEYREKNMDLVTAISNLSNLAEQVATAGKELHRVATLFSKSDFSDAMQAFDKRILLLDEAEKALSDQSKEIMVMVGNVLTECKSIRSEFQEVNHSLGELLEMKNTVNESKQLLAELAVKINRIDRNTQSVFKKERG